MPCISADPHSNKIKIIKNEIQKNNNNKKKVTRLQWVNGKLVSCVQRQQ